MVSRLSQVWSRWGQQGSASRVRAAQEPSPIVHLQEAVTDPGVGASGDDALDLRVVGQVAHGVLNVYADALALDIKARSPEEIFKLEHFECI